MNKTVENKHHVIDQNPQQKNESGKRIRSKYAAYSAAVILIVLAIAIGLNVILTTLEDSYDLKVDLTQNAVYALSDQTKQVLDQLDGGIVFYTLFRIGEGRENSKLTTRIVNVLKKYDDYSQQIRVENVDPLLNPAFAQQFDREGKGIAENSIIVTNEDKSRFKVLALAQLFVLDENNNPVGIDAEQKVTSAVYYVKTGNSSSVRFLQGHYERAVEDLLPLVQLMQYSNAEVRQYNCLTDEKLNVRNDVLVIAGPKSDLSDAELELLKQYVLSGGKILAMIDPVNSNELKNFRELFKLYNVDLLDDVVLETDSKQYYKNQLNLIPRLVKMPLTQPLIDDNLAPILPLCRSVVLLEDADNEQAGVMPMLMTTENAYTKTDESNLQQPKQSGDPTGPFVVGAAAYFYNSENPDIDLRSKLVIFGTSQFATDSELMQTQGNIDLLLSSVGWLLNRSDAVSIQAKFIGNQSFIIQSETTSTLIIILLAFIPLAVLIAGIAVFLKRKNL